MTMPIIATMVPTGSLHFMMVSGTSMEPTITASDIVVVNAVDSGGPELGDIISYRHYLEDRDEPVVIIHRIVGFSNDGYRTKGDAYDVADSYVVKPEDIVGVMCLKIPYLGGLPRFASTSKGLIMLVIIPAVIVITSEIYSIFDCRGTLK
ncbi:signal peptidase I [Methanococcoides seepicolus]|uniref:Signal peptidase I n=2 Tax=Methanococcoides seepicolus TaxID=2828780 RepID=A0A9E4ZG71_9EURY|nr:signal peptidase I [Methanococcoides seepicolus]